MKKLFIIVNLDTFFLSHRKEIALRARQKGFDVTIVAKDTGKGDEIKGLGLNFINLPINKAGLNLLEELKTFSYLYKLFKKEGPDIVHAVGMKTILWGGLAMRLSGIKRFVSAVCGLGVMFSPEYNKGLKRILSQSVLFVMKYIHRNDNTYCIFHNTEDMQMFISSKIIDEGHCVRTMGSGIDLKEYSYKPEIEAERLRVLFTARMVEDKGVLTLIEAANKLRDSYKDRVEFFLCGGLDTNPLAITRERLEALCDGTYIKWLGRRDDIQQLLESCHLFAFPSYYKEGLPKSCIEAAAVGRPIITCDSTGCRDTVIDGKTGFLIPAKDSDALAEKLRILFDDAALRREMGCNARKFAEEKFSIETVVQSHIDIYNSIV
ncbi:MAG: glycosyltransferase family 4 protein [Bacteroidales bacterium]|nr:glycosyltransferase family 4 protein [Bacteroidales bacterium]